MPSHNFHHPARQSPLRYTSFASNSSTDDTTQHPTSLPPSRVSTFSSPASQTPTSRKRSIRETSPTKTSALPDYQYMKNDRSPPRFDTGDRPSLRPLPQGENMRPPTAPQTVKPSQVRSSPTENLTATFDHARSQTPEPAKPKAKQQQQYSMGLSRSDSRKAPVSDRGRARQHDGPISPQSSLLNQSELEKLGRSATGHLRTLSKLSNQNTGGDFKITSPEQAVVGMHGRRRLQGNMSQTGRKLQAPGYGGRTWMDEQRRFLAAYEYLCHIGEAKEWIEDIINKQIPPIVQLEEALRDGVTLVEIVQAVHPERTYRVFRNPKLQYRHSDNIAIFFKFLAEVELPDLFRFELIDLYEKKNIPKVIHCIHALSWTLFRKGMVGFRIGDLLGQLQFEEHELEEVQKGLDKAGVSMPNFSGMGEKLGGQPEPEPEPEPSETDEERIERELDECQYLVPDLQAQMRGAMVRLRLGDTMQYLWDNEHEVIELQARIRGDFARQVLGYKLQMRQFAVRLQGASRGFLVRSRERRKKQHWQGREKDVLRLQSLVRARASRAETQQLKSKLSTHQHGVKKLQASIRGLLARWNVGDQYQETREGEPAVIKLQAAIRGFQKRHHHQGQSRQLVTATSQVTNLQSLIRSAKARQEHQAHAERITRHNDTWVNLSSLARGHLVRQELSQTRALLQNTKPAVVHLQAKLRATQTRQLIAAQKVELFRHEKAIISLQSAARAVLSRRTHHTTQRHLRSSQPELTVLQAQARAFLSRSRVFDLLDQLRSHESQVVELQACARAMMVRDSIGDDIEQLSSEEPYIEDLQSIIRGMLIRSRFEEKKRFYHENMKKVIKLQSFVRGKQQGEAYKSLTTGKNPPVGTVKNFVHLLNDSDFDFDEEIESEKLQKTLLQRVQGNEQLEHAISDMDVKIGLLAQTKITSDEAVRMRRQHNAFTPGGLDRHGSVRGSFNPKTLNRNSKAKIDRYGELIYYLQTQPQYFARLFRTMREHGTMNLDSKKLETLIMGAFAFAQKRREEYLLLKLISQSIQEEVSACGSLDDFVRGNFFFGRLFGAYTRVPRDRKYVRHVFGPVMRARFVDHGDLDLESDPLQIYRALLSDEQLRTGRASSRPADMPREEIIKDKEVRSIYVRHLMDIRTVVGEVLTSLEDTLQHMPFGTRFVTQQMFSLLQAKFPRAEEEHLLTVTGNWLWRTYLRAAWCEPESCGVVDKALEPKQRRNLAQISKVLTQITLGRLFDVEDQYLGPLNTDIEASIGRWRAILYDAINIPPAESRFDISESNDLYAKVKPTLLIKMPDVVLMHEMIANELSFICVSPEDNTMREVLRDLGNPKTNEAEMGAGSAEITLTLSGRVHAAHDPDAEIKNLYMETKRCVLYIIRVQASSNLLEIMVKPITPEDEDRWATLVHEELAHNSSARRRNAYTDTSSSSLTDLASMSYAELKSIALENILALEAAGRLSRHNHYQDILNEIAVDIRQKHRRRVQRQQDIERTRSNIAHLEEKHHWLEERLTAYSDTYDQNLVILQGKSAKDRTKGKFVMPFSKQWHHQREMERLGREPRYGSYKRSAENFAAKGILLSWEGHDLRNDDITISSDQINQFLIEGSSGSMMITGASDSFSWDSLLEADYEGKDVMEFFVNAGLQVQGGSARGGRSGGARRDVLRLDTKMFKAWMSKKFFPDG